MTTTTPAQDAYIVAVYALKPPATGHDWAASIHLGWMETEVATAEDADSLRRLLWARGCTTD